MKPLILDILNRFDFIKIEGNSCTIEQVAPSVSQIAKTGNRVMCQ